MVKKGFFLYLFFLNYILDKRKYSDPIKLFDITTLVPITRFKDLYTHLPDRDGCSYIGCRAVQAYKLVIPMLGITIHVSWERNFKSKEADYSKRVASSLLAS